jgi:hypothetical protein
MTDAQALLRTRLTTAIDALRNLIVAHDLPLETRIALATSDARLRDELARLQTTIDKG